MSLTAIIDVKSASSEKSVKVAKSKITKDHNVEIDCKLFGDRLRESMEKCGVTQADLSRFMDVSRSAVNWWVQGMTYPSIENTKKLANYLRTTPEYLLFGVVHVAEERLVESIPVINRMGGKQVEFTRLTLPREFMARAHLNVKNLKALSIFTSKEDTIAIADTTDRTVNSREPKLMVIDHGGKIEVGSVVKKPGDGGIIYFEADGRTIEITQDDATIVGRLAASVTTNPSKNP